MSAGAQIQALLGDGMRRHQGGQLQQAAQIYGRVLAMDPQQPDALHLMGLVLMQSGRPAQALEPLRKAIAIQGRIAAYHFHYGQALQMLGTLAEAEDSYRRALSFKPGDAEICSGLGAICWMSGRREDALEWYRKALAATPNAPDVLTYLGAGLWQMGRLEEAEPPLARAATLQADPAMLNNWANLLHALGKTGEAMAVLGRSLALAELPQTKQLFVNMARRGGWAEGNENLRPFLVRALREPWDRPEKLSLAAGELIRQRLAALVARANAAWPRRLGTEELLEDGGFAALADDDLLMALLIATPNCDMALERFLTLVRAALLERARTGAADDKTLAFAAALARQCFINEYVFLPARDEAAKAETLIANLGADSSPLSVLVAACYRPLHTMSGLKREGWPSALEAVLKQQLDEPREEKRLAAEIARLTPIDNDVSKRVQGQYEVNPYPRWVYLTGSGAPGGIRPFLMQKFPGADFNTQSAWKDLLIAGCGTGRHSISRAKKFPDADILAVDLSLASLAYAKRKSRELGEERIQYGHADILQLPTLGRQFDVVESIGVLNTMADPFAGWRALLAMARPKGFMLLGIYSKRARVPIAAIRERITKRLLDGDADAMREFRQDLFDGDAEGSLAAITQSDDFFSLSACRDLLFHVQEIPVTLEEIARFVKENNLTFLGFEMEDMVMQAYRARFPQDAPATDLTNWAIFEEDNPGIFAAMYVFWTQKS